MSQIQKTDPSTPNKKSDFLSRKDKECQVGDIFLNDGYDVCICRIREILEDKVFYDRLENNGEWRNYGSEDKKRFEEKHASHILDVPLSELIRETEEILDGKRSIEDYRDREQPISASTDLIHVTSKETLEILHSSMEAKRRKVDQIQLAMKMQIEKRKRELEAFRHDLLKIVEDFQHKVEQIQKVIYTIELYLGIKEDIVQIQSGQSSSEPIYLWQNTLFMDEEVGDPMDDMKGLDFSNISEFDKWLLKYSNFYKKYNYELLIPQSKGLICLRVRRHDKEYYQGDNSFLSRMHNSDLNKLNKKTYILIRNGTNLYRIWGDISIYPYLFPSKENLQSLRDRWEELEEMIENAGTPQLKGEVDHESLHNDNAKKYIHWNGDTSKAEEEKRAINNELFRYKQHFIMLQGLLDRTEVFYPILEPFSFVSPEAQEKGLVNFVYDDDMRLTDGRPSFRDWQKEANKTIQAGSRIVFVNSVDDGGHHERGERYDRRYAYSYNEKNYRLPSLPNTGLYQVKTYSTKENVYITAIAQCKEELPQYVIDRYISGHFDDPTRFPFEYNIQVNGYERTEKKTVDYLAIYYNPKDEVVNLWDYHDMGHERMKSVSYKIFHNDLNILHYDGISLEDIDYYLYERRHRHNYLRMIPILWKIKQLREDEIKQELEFVKGLIQDMQKHNQKISNPKEKIWEAVEWYKTKNKWKRPLTGDDSLAWRMIRSRLGLKNS